MRADWQALLAGGERWTLVANLPYNVATPLVCDLLDGVPAIESMLVMVQREVAERFAAPPGNKQYGAVSVKVAYWATARIVGHVPASVFVPRPNVESALVRIDRREPPDGRSGGAVRAGSDRVRAAAQDAAAVARRRRRRRRCSRPPACRPRHAPSSSRSTTGCASRTPPARHERPIVEAARRRPSSRCRCASPASAHDGLHLIDAEMVSLSLHDVVTIDPEGDGVTTTGRYADGVPSDDRNIVAKALWLVERRAGVTIDKRIPHGGGLGGGSSDAAAVLRWAGFDDAAAAAVIGADVPFCLVGGRAQGARDRRDRRTAAARRPPRDAGRAAAVGQHRRPCTAPGTSWAARRRPAPTTSSRRRSGSSRRWRIGGTGSATPCGETPMLAGQRRHVVGAGRTRRRPRRIARRGRRGDRADRPGARRGAAVSGCELLATLVAGAAQHLLVLLLAHPLAALLDERTHKERHATGARLEAPTIRRARRYA